METLIEVGTKVRIRFQAGYFNDRFYRSGWRVGTVAAHSHVGESGAYDVALRDGNTITHCSPLYVRRAGTT